VYSTFVGGSKDETGWVSVDTSGNAYLAGSTESPDFPVTPGAFDTSYNSRFLSDTYVAKLSADGSSLVYGTFLGGADIDEGRAVAVDSTGNAYVTGNTSSADLPTTPGAFDTTFNGDSDGFVSELSADGSALVYSTYLGGSGQEWPAGIVADGKNVYVTGSTNSTNFPTTPGAFDGSANGGYDGFVTKFTRMARAPLQDKPVVP
jgi:hypothetical protein